MKWVTVVELVESGDVGGLVPVVDFLGDALGDLPRSLSRVGHRGARRRARESKKRGQHFGVRQISADRLRCAGVLDLDRNLAAVVQDGRDAPAQSKLPLPVGR